MIVPETHRSDNQIRVLHDAVIIGRSRNPARDD